MATRQARQPDWDSITGSILEESCVLFIGTQVNDNAQAEKPLFKVFLKELYEKSKENSESKEDLIAFYEHDGFLLFADGKRTKYSFKIKKFYEQIFAKEQFSKLAQIPFKLIVLLRPDVSVNVAFDDLKLPYQYDFFDKREKKEIKGSPSKDNPLIYGMVGSIKESNTLVISHQDLFEYLKAIFEYDLPLEIRTILSKATQYIFLGCEFDQWYFQLLVNLFKLKNTNLLQSAFNVEPPKDIELWENHLKVEFIDHDITAFINKLHEKIAEYGELKNVGNTAPQQYKLDAIHQLLSEAYSAEGFVTLCMLHFYEAYNRFGSGMSKEQQIQHLLDYVVRHRLADKLLAIVEKDNPAQYQAHQPYF